METLTQELRAFVVDNFLYGQEDGILNGESLLERGVVDSTGVLELVGFLERTYGIHVEDQELAPANLDSIDRLTAFVTRKLQEKEPRRAD